MCGIDGPTTLSFIISYALLPPVTGVLGYSLARALREGMAHLSQRTPGGVYHAPAPTRRYIRPRQNGRLGRCARRLPVGTFYMDVAVSAAPRAHGKAVEHGTAPLRGFCLDEGDNRC